MLEPYAPHLAEELNAQLGNDGLLSWEAWPEVDTQWLVTETVKVPVQINGKVRLVIDAPKDADPASLEAQARAEPSIAQLLEQGEVKKVVAVPGRIVNFVVKPS